MSAPACPKCGSTANMVQHDGEWVCHSTHPVSARPLEHLDLVENLDIENLQHAEKFLLCEESRIDGALELRCGNNNRWAAPKNHVNHGHVVCAYENLRQELTDTRKLLATYSAEREDFRDFLKELYNLSSFDWDSMPEDLRRKFQGVLLRAIDEKLQTTHTP